MSDQHIRSHAAHPSRSQNSTIAEMSDDELPSQLLHSESAYVQAMLEELDDVIFMAVRGDSAALTKAQSLWPRVVDAIGWELVEESREQYLRFAIDVTTRYEDERVSKPEQAIAAIEIISLLAKD